MLRGNGNELINQFQYNRKETLKLLLNNGSSFNPFFVGSGTAKSVRQLVLRGSETPHRGGEISGRSRERGRGKKNGATNAKNDESRGVPGSTL